MGTLSGKSKMEGNLGFKANYRLYTALITFICDFAALIISILLAHVTIYHALHFDTILRGEFGDILFLIICLSLFTTSRLYPGIGLNPALEMKMVTQLSMLGFFICFGFLMMRTPFWTEEKLALILVAGFSIPLILALRWAGRIMAVQMGLWGEPVVVVADKAKIENMMRFFDERRRLGFIPILGISVGGELSSVMNILDAGELHRLSDGYFSQNGIQTVLVSTWFGPGLSRQEIDLDLLRKFKRVIFISDMDWLEGVSITTHDFEGMLGVETRQNFLTPWNKLLKRTMDIVLSVSFGIASSPVLMLTAMLIKLDSPGSVLYKQQRVGQDGKEITVYKFRSMRADAEEALEKYILQSPEVQQEWSENQKLRADPRITRVGKWMRKYSVDELPQLYNILKGDMSVVGPRPIMLEQQGIYGDGLKVYRSVRPGLTGFWQVSGRNHTSFSQRVIYDVYYVRNWSVWLDMYILLRTIWVVISSHGAY